MSWRVIFTGAICLSLAIVLSAVGVSLRNEFPWLPAAAIVADFGVVLAGLETILDTTKTANELRKMEFEVRKLRLEIDEKQRAAEKEGAHIVVATLEEIKEYAPLSRRATGSRWSSAITATSLTVIGFAAVFVMGIFQNRLPLTESTNKNSAIPLTHGEEAEEREIRARSQEKQWPNLNMTDDSPDSTRDGAARLACSAVARGRLLITAAGSHIVFKAYRKDLPSQLRLAIWIGGQRLSFPLNRNSSVNPSDSVFFANQHEDVRFLASDVQRAEIQSENGPFIAECLPER